jgi:hypothetical protein
LLFDGVKVLGKLQASGAIELRNGVSIGDKVESKFVVQASFRVAWKK